jgi:rhamnulokinase
LAQLAPFHLAIDLGAGSGRAMVGGMGAGAVVLREAHRFHYGPREASGHLRWDFGALMSGIEDGIRKAPLVAAELGGRIESIGVDSWGVDYGFIDAAGHLVEEPIAYRDGRNQGVMERVAEQLGREDIFSRTGIQFLPFNTIYQLVAHVRDGVPAGAARLLMIPDLCHHRLCGSVVSEQTNASTTQLLRADGVGWDQTLFERLGLPRELMPEVVPAGTTLGIVSPSLQTRLGVPGWRVVAPATHDTGSAVAGTPLTPGWAYISSGTWSLVGVERSSPLVNSAAAAANFTNEAGAFGTTRFLKNVMGLWLLEQCRKEWAEAGLDQDYGTLLSRVEAIGESVGLVFPDHPRFFNPKSMIGEIRAALVETGQVPSEDPVVITKVILDSLALRYASVIATIEQLTGKTVPGIHIVGGGSQNAYLNQATADAAGRPVLAGPVEATAYGNILVQAIACGGMASLSEGRRILREGLDTKRFEPRQAAVWAAAAGRYREIERRYFL